MILKHLYILEGYIQNYSVDAFEQTYETDTKDIFNKMKEILESNTKNR